MLRSPIQRRCILGIQSENDIANIFSKLDCEFDCFHKIYPCDGTSSLYLSLHSVIIFKIHMMRGISYIWRLVQSPVGLTQWLNFIYNSPWLYRMYFGSKFKSEFRLQLDISEGAFMYIAVITTYSVFLSWMVSPLTAH